MFVFNLPTALLELLELDDQTNSHVSSDSKASPEEVVGVKGTQSSVSSLMCVTCQVEAEDKSHFKSDFHRYNLKRRVNSQAPLSEDAYEELEDVSSIEASSDDDGETGDCSIYNSKSKEGSPFVHYIIQESSGTEPKEELLIYKQVLSSAKTKDDADFLSLLKNIQISERKEAWTLIMMASGHFSAAIIDLLTFKPLIHKTFHRYTTRRKQGGAQSSNDKSKGKANSAGAGIRRYNEQALVEEVHELLKDWKTMIQSSSRIFIRAPVTSRAQLFFDHTIINPTGKLVSLVLTTDDRIRSFPFITKRPTLKELMRCFEELATVKQQPYVRSYPAIQKEGKLLSKVDEYEKKVIEAVRKGNIPMVESYLQKGLFAINSPLSDSSDISLLHLAAKHSQSKMIEYLLENGADPSQQIAIKPYDLADAKESRDVFRRFMGKYPDRWDYSLTGIHSPLTPEMEKLAAERTKEKRKRDKERKRAEKKEAAPVITDIVDDDDVPLVGMKNVALSKSVKESLGMSAEQRQRIDREKRALAAEARMKNNLNQCGHCKMSLSKLDCFEKKGFRYCSMQCLNEQSILF